MVDMLMVRGLRPAEQVRTRQRRVSIAKLPLVDRNIPPAASRKAPTSAGRQAILRIAMPPPRTRCKP